MNMRNWYRRNIKGMETLEEAEADVNRIGLLIGHGNVGMISTGYIREVVEGKFVIALVHRDGHTTVTSKPYRKEPV